MKTFINYMEFLSFVKGIMNLDPTRPGEGLFQAQPSGTRFSDLFKISEM